tara:strand:+ start:83 stop:667 length:585 start_codon:yes stop_codon:yes gene_type:complete
MREYYVYTHLNPKTKDVFYVGIGKGNRAYNKWAGRNKFWDNYVNKHGFEVELVAEGLTRAQAGKIEIKLIAELGRRQIDEGGTLVNRSTGGDGGSVGYTHTEAFKQKLSLDRKGKTKTPHSKETKDKLSKSLTGREVTWGKTILQYDKQGNFIKEWPSAKEATRETGAKNIFEVASGYKNQLYKSSGGYIWEYK